MAADEEDMPFRWSLFLPAKNDTPSLRGLKYAVIGMGVILILGFFVILGRIVYLTSRMDASVPIGEALTLSMPKGADVVTMALDGNRLAVHFTGPEAGERAIKIIDLRTGHTISHLRLEAVAEPPTAPETTGRPASGN
ncbi:MAG: hypothetical protein ACK5KM_07325 [Hyphomicrobiaceae bacterium]